ncbi:protein-L-isoaspartate O-methyltransferase [Actinocatenispora thailandica]|uniref:Protein-L-isoaspartate O-methyltransferase n=1 Tax=Actinocatenispora thailandica TaxID=227318 RepID=A0A7R7DJB6_9ACTN|nr:methyltransferase domain-containing protein [Actinocatenispora thailandica]BCJ32536.1 protein-L-isoaspartate O-methyltransferase [Actinocatenispora thailandica]
MTDPATAHARMVDQLVASGELRTGPWIRAFRTIPRHVFLPRLFWPTPTGDWAAVDADDPEWIDRVYAVTSIVTQLDNDPNAWAEARRASRPGMPTSSSSDPGLMATMLEALDIHDGHSVLEIGTGTGYNAALLAERLGDSLVTSIEVDPVLADQAHATLAAVGRAPSIVTGDGRDGVPDRAPYDRIIATVSAPTVPAAWIQQTRPGGLILLNLYAELGGGALALLTAGDGRAEGKFLANYGAFMPTRDAQPDRTTQERFTVALRDPAGERGQVDVAANALDDLDFAMFAALLVPATGWLRFMPDGEPTQLWLLAEDAWAMIDTNGATEEHGPRHLAGELADAHRTWRELGSPSRDRLGMTITRGGQRLWLDGPDRAIDTGRYQLRQGMT